MEWWRGMGDVVGSSVRWQSSCSEVVGGEYIEGRATRERKKSWTMGGKKRKKEQLSPKTYKITPDDELWFGKVTER